MFTRVVPLFIFIFLNQVVYTQQGFRKLYLTDSTGYQLTDIHWTGDRLVTMGQYLTATAPNGALNGLLYMELDTNGTILHSDIYYEPDDANTSGAGNSILQLSNGNILVLSQTLFQKGLLINEYKDSQLSRTIKIPFSGFSAVLLGCVEWHGALYLSGWHQGADHEVRGFLIKTDLQFNTIWERQYGQNGVYYASVSIQPLSGGMFALPVSLGYPGLTQTAADNWTRTKILVCDSLGNIITTMETTNNVESGVMTSQLQKTNTNNFIYGTARFVPQPNNIDRLFFFPKIVCRDSNFHLLWERELTKHESPDHRMRRLVPTPDGNFVCLGVWDDYNRAMIHKFAPNGDSIWSYGEKCPNPGFCLYQPNGLTTLPSGSVYAIGTMFDVVDGTYTGVLLKLNKDGCMDTLNCTTTKIEETQPLITADQIKVYPNPASTHLRVEQPIGEVITLYDIHGALVLEQSVQSEIEVVNIAKFPTGTYFLKMKTEKLSVTYKVLRIE